MLDADELRERRPHRGSPKWRAMRFRWMSFVPPPTTSLIARRTPTSNGLPARAARGPRISSATSLRSSCTSDPTISAVGGCADAVVDEDPCRLQPRGQLGHAPADRRAPRAGETGVAAQLVEQVVELPVHVGRDATHDDALAGESVGDHFPTAVDAADARGIRDADAVEERRARDL